MNTSPDIDVAHRIIERLRKAGLLNEDTLNRLLTPLVSGSLSAVHWRTLVERDIHLSLTNHISSNTSEVQDDKKN